METVEETVEMETAETEMAKQQSFANRSSEQSS